MLGIGADIWNTNRTNKQQQEHDEAMAALNHRYREEEAQTSFERQVNFNQYESDVQKMVNAGISPSLMYGGSVSPAVPSISSVGSSQGAGSMKKPNISDFLGKLDPLEYGSQTLERMNLENMREKTKSDILKNNQEILESISRTNENKRRTDFEKSLEWTRQNQEAQILRNLQLSNRSLDFDIGMKIDTKPLQMRKLALENDELVKKIDFTAEQIRTEPLRRKGLDADVRVANEYINNLSAGVAESKERTKTSQLGRIMSEFGLNARSITMPIREWSNLNPAMKKRLNGACIALEECGYSHEEALGAVLYYCASDAKDIKPSAVNAFSRILSSALK